MRCPVNKRLFATVTLTALVACLGPGSGPGPDPDDDSAEVDAGVPVVEELPPLGDGVGTLSGASTAGRTDGRRGVARFANPVNVAVGADGGLVVCDFDNGLLRVVGADGDTTTPFTLPAGFARPFGLVRNGGTLWVQTDRATTGAPTGALWRVSLADHRISLVRDGFGRFRGLGVLSDGRLVGADYQQHVVSIIDPATGAATPLAGAANQAGKLDATGSAARFDTPYDLLVLPGDDVVIADQGNHVLRKVSLDGSVVTLAGTFASPQGLARDGLGRIYVSDPATATISRIATDGTISVIAGAGIPGHKDDADPRAAMFFGLEGIDVSVDGSHLYVADGSGGEDLPYHRVRRLSLR